jgi:hypothetical protein
MIFNNRKRKQAVIDFFEYVESELLTNEEDSEVINGIKKQLKSGFELIEKRFTPTKSEILELEKQLDEQIKVINKNKPNQGKGYGPIIHRKLKKYDRQYIGFIDQYGQKVIHVNFIWNGYSIWEAIKGWTKPDESWKTEWQMWFDGGSRFWNINYIIDKKEFIDFQVNGVA